MINIKFNNQTYNIKTTIYEFDITTFEKLIQILNNKEYSLYDKWINVFKLVDIPDDIINSLSIDEFNNIVSEFDLKIDIIDIYKSIKIDGVEYFAYKNKFDISIKDFILMQNYLDVNPLKNITKVMAILYKSKEEIKNNVNFDYNYIDAKSLKFKSVTSNYCIPIYNLLNTILLETIKSELNEKS